MVTCFKMNVHQRSGACLAVHLITWCFIVIPFIALLSCNQSKVDLPPSDVYLYLFTDSPEYSRFKKDPNSFTNKDEIRLGSCTYAQALKLLADMGFEEKEESSMGSGRYFFKLQPDGRDKINIWVWKYGWDRTDDVDMGLEGIEELRRSAQ